MEKWRQHLRSLNPRIDLRETFYPEQLEPRHPALLSSGSLLATSLVALRLLNIIATRGGTRMKPTWTHRLCGLLEDALLPEAIVHCDDEVARILDWLEGRAETLPPDTDQLDQNLPSPTPELDIMFAAELESRISVAQFALTEHFDLQLEYYDEKSKSWPRLRVTPLDILRTPADAPDDQPAILLLVSNSDAQQLTIPFQSIRWLMPVTRNTTDPEPHPEPTVPKDPSPGRLLSFPGSPRPNKQ